MHLDATILMKLLNFALMGGLLYKFALKPLGGILDKEAAEVAASFASLRAEKQKAENDLKSNENLLQKAEQEIEDLLKNAASRAAENRRDIEAEMESDLERLDHTEQEKIRLIWQHGRKMLQHEFAKKSASVATRLVSREATSEDRQNWNLQFINKLN